MKKTRPVYFENLDGRDEPVGRYVLSVLLSRLVSGERLGETTKGKEIAREVQEGQGVKLKSSSNPVASETEDAKAEGQQS